MYTKQLTSPADQAAFVAAFQLNDGTSITQDYRQKSQVWGCYRNNRLVAGFIINRTPKFRYMEHFSEEETSQLFQEHHLTEVSEITCIWHERNRPFPILPKTQLYLQSILKTINRHSVRNNTPIMGGSFNAKVAERQKTLLTKQLFWDVVDVNGQKKVAQIYYARTRQVILRFPLAIGMMIGQEIKKALQKQGRLLISRLFSKSASNTR